MSSITPKPKSNKIKSIWNNRKLIAEGIKNRVFKKEHVEEIYNDRLEICKGCDLIDLSGHECMVPGTQPCCGECGCSLALKLRSLSAACGHPKGAKWEALISYEEEEAFEKEKQNGIF